MVDSGALLTISAGGDAPALGSLYAWLVRTPDVTRHGAVQVTPARGGSSMNAVDTVGVVISSATAIANVLLAYSTWRRTRVKSPAMTITLGHVTVAIEDPEAQERLVSALSGDGHAA